MNFTSFEKAFLQAVEIVGKWHLNSKVNRGIAKRKGAPKGVPSALTHGLTLN